jgi:tRNA(Ile)-lysidine synthase
VAGAAQGSRRKFGPAVLGAQLAQLLPQFPQVSLCVAFSGGADSTALLAALVALKQRGLKLRALHIDHGLQRDSVRWSRHCRRIARALSVPIQVCRVRVARRPGVSPEAAARSARYAALAAHLKGGELLLTAHHAEDQLETVLLQLLRGAGVAGQAAMPARAAFAHSELLRPLLQVPGAQLRAWLATLKLPWVEDPSNQDERFDRNYLRLRVLPVLCARWPAAAATVGRGARHAAEAQQLLDELAAADCRPAQVGRALAVAALRRLPPARRRNALRYWITQSGFQAPPARRLGELAEALLAARADTHPFITWEGVRCARVQDLLTLEPHVERSAAALAAARTPEAAAWRWRQVGSVQLPQGGTLTLRFDPRGPLDLDALAPVLTLRARRGGERLRPAAGAARRTLKGLLQEARVPLQERARLPLIFCGDTLVAVADLFLDASVQAGAATRRRGRLSYRAH